MIEYLMMVMAVAGVACVAGGAWMAWEPAGPLVVGVALVVVPVLWVRGGWASSTG